MKLFTEYKCVHCGYGIYSENVYQYSNHLYGLTLCLKCQKIFQNNKSTMESRILYKALRERNVPVELEVFDGHKTIDLVVKSLKINIEVDGVHHNANSKQASSDLIRTLCSYRKGYITFRIPNSIIHNSLEEQLIIVLFASVTCVEKNLLTSLLTIYFTKIVFTICPISNLFSLV